MQERRYLPGFYEFSTLPAERQRGLLTTGPRFFRRIRSLAWGSRGEDCGMHGLRYYEVRLRRSRRTPYVVARMLLALVALAVALIVVLHLANSF